MSVQYVVKGFTIRLSSIRIVVQITHHIRVIKVECFAVLILYTRLFALVHTVGAVN